MQTNWDQPRAKLGLHQERTQSHWGQTKDKLETYRGYAGTTLGPNRSQTVSNCVQTVSKLCPNCVQTGATLEPHWRSSSPNTLVISPSPLRLLNFPNAKNRLELVDMKQKQLCEVKHLRGTAPPSPLSPCLLSKVPKSLSSFSDRRPLC